MTQGQSLCHILGIRKTDVGIESEQAMKDENEAPASKGEEVIVVSPSDQDDAEGKKPENSRYQVIVKYSIIGIIANVLLAGFKAAVGFLAGSIAVILDGLNSLTDAFSSIATIIGEKIASMPPSRKHPYGYGRAEYITSLIIAAIIMAAGLVSIRESIVKILEPTSPDYDALTLIVLVVATLAKVVIGIAFVRKGKAVNSQPLRASGIDAEYDAILTFGTLVAALICLIWGVDLDGWVGLIISFFVVKAGFDVLRDGIGSIIGERPSQEKANDIRELVAEHEGVLGVYDLVLDSFGPEKYIGSCHIEVRDDMTACEIHELTRHVSEDVYREYNTLLTIGIYASNSTGEFAVVHNKLNELVEHHPEILQVHGFYVDKEDNSIDFDLVVDFHEDAEGLRQHIVDEMKELYPQYNYNVIIDLDYS